MARIATKRRISAYDMSHEYVAGGAAESGNLGFLDAAGDLIESNGITAGIPVGRIETDGVSGDSVRVSQGVFLWANSGVNTLTVADRWAPCYAEGPATVGSLNTNPFAGIVYDVTSEGVWVLTALGISDPTA